MHRWHDSRGFTLIEMLVVIGIIAVLVAIIFPVFTTAREKARQARCRTNLSQLVTALKAYRTDYGMYPATINEDTDLVVGVWYDDPEVEAGYPDDEDRYKGGFSALYPDYIQDKNLLICPDDKDVKVLKKEAMDRVYSSYNGDAGGPNSGPANGDWILIDTDPDSPRYNMGTVLYNYYSYNPEGYDIYDVPGGLLTPWLVAQNLSARFYPRLYNTHAPDNTIVTHCVSHREFYSEDRQRDVIVRLNGESDTVEVSLMETLDATLDVAPWVHQNF